MRRRPTDAPAARKNRLNATLTLRRASTYSVRPACRSTPSHTETPVGLSGGFRLFTWTADACTLARSSVSREWTSNSTANPTARHARGTRCERHPRRQHIDGRLSNGTPGARQGPDHGAGRRLSRTHRALIREGIRKVNCTSPCRRMEATTSAITGLEFLPKSSAYLV